MNNHLSFRRRLDVLEGRVHKSAPDVSPGRPSRIANDPAARALLIAMHEAVAERRFEDAELFKREIARRLHELHQPEGASVGQPNVVVQQLREEAIAWHRARVEWRYEDAARLKLAMTLRLHELDQGA